MGFFNGNTKKISKQTLGEGMWACLNILLLPMLGPKIILQIAITLWIPGSGKLTIYNPQVPPPFTILIAMPSFHLISIAAHCSHKPSSPLHLISLYTLTKPLLISAPHLIISAWTCAVTCDDKTPNPTQTGLSLNSKPQLRWALGTVQRIKSHFPGPFTFLLS